MMKKNREYIKVRKYFHDDTDRLIDKYVAASEKYRLIWDYYREQMPQCINECKNKMYDVVKGPQGVYWIGGKIKILFVGLENYGWEISKDFEKVSQFHILYKPLQFAFYDAYSMPNYWAHIKYNILYNIIRNLSGNEILADRAGKYGWYWVLDYVGFTNLCKCFAPAKSVKNRLHNNCKENNFIFKEIEVIDSPINIMFTLSNSIIDDLPSGTPNLQKSKDIFNGKIWKRNVEGRVFYELHHPSRQNLMVTEKLNKDLIKEIKMRNIVFE